MRVPFSPPDIRQSDIDAVVDVLQSGWITTGPVGAALESRLQEYTGAAGAVAMNSCTAALEAALRLMGIGPGDEVIVPAYTYTASASVVLHVGADLAFVDVAPHQYVPSVAQITAAVTPRTRAIIVVDIAGIPFPTAELIAALEEEHRNDALPLGRPVVIVDAAHSLGARRGGQRAGQIGDLTAFSFHAVKNLTTAEGGALVWRPGLPGDDAELVRAAKRVALHGQDKDALAKSKAGKWEYDILEPAYKWNMPDVLAALGLSQLDRYDEMVARRLEIVAAYDRGLSDLVTMLDHQGDDFTSSAHLAITNLGERAPARNWIIDRLAEQGIASNVHYKPLPMMTAYRNLGFDIADFPHAEEQYRATLTLPLHTLLSDEDVALVIEQYRAAIDESED